MRILVFGGSVFLSRAVAEQAAGRGHDVVAACRGSHPVPAAATHVVFDRDDPDWSLLAGHWDAVVDTQESPTWITSALDALAEDTDHWTYVSSISAYADDTVPNGTPDTLELRQPVFDEDDSMDPANYGGRKVACEQLVADRAGTHLLVRPGLIIGPGDRSGRFTHWPIRLGTAGAGTEVLAPGDPADPMQVIDVRDLAAWHVHAIETGLTGTFDATGPRTTMGALLDEVAEGVGADVVLRWAAREVLEAHDVEPWMGPRSVPLWLPQPEHAGMVSHDVTATVAAGLTTRPVAETAHDTLVWATDDNGDIAADVVTTGITLSVERELLASIGT